MKEHKATVKDYIWVLKGISIPWKAIIAIFAASMISAYAGLNISFFTGDMVDALGNVPTDKLAKYAISYLLIGIGAALSVVATSYASEHINLGLRDKLWRKIMYTNGKYYDSDGGESLVSRITTDCDFSSKLLAVAVEAISLIISTGIYISQMLKLNITMALAMLFLIPLSVLIGVIYAKVSFSIGRKTQESLAASTAYLAERTANINLIKTSNAQMEELENGLECFEEQYRMQLRTQLLSTSYVLMQHLYSILTVLVPFLIGAKLVNNHVIRAGTVIAFYSIAGTVGINATNFINYVGDIKKANGALVRVINVLRLPDERDMTGEEINEIKGDLEISHVDFFYGEKQILFDFTATIPHGKVTALLGPNGSGKSTLFKLIDRINEPDSGALLLNGKNISEIDIHAWRKLFCYVSQDCPLMEGTIRENICYGYEGDVTEEELIRICKQAEAYEFISALPDGFDTKLSSGGTNLSGGQKQCLAIARALLNDAEILLLDEATSNLDSHRENKIIEALNNLMEGRTTIIISHSLATIRNADHVIVMRDGTVVETGTPESVMEKPGNYLNKLANRGIEFQS